MASQVLLDQQIITGGSATTGVKAIGLCADSIRGQALEYTFYVQFDHTSAAGTVVIESAYDNSWASGNTWANQATVNWAAIDRAHTVQLTGCFGALRARISSAITSGTVDVYVIASSN
jgi:hypothetical protein